MNTRVITVLNEKGGCGKTTTALQLAYFLAQDQKVLLIDTDQHAHSTLHLTDRADHKMSSYDLFKSEGEIPIKKLVLRPIHSSWGNLLLVPGDRRLANLEKDLSSAIDRDRILERAIASTNNFFDYIIIDTPSVLEIEARNALIASTHYLIVTDLSRYSELGISTVRVFADRIKTRANKKLKELGVILIGYQKDHANIVKEVLKDFKEEENFLHEWVIPNSVDVMAAQRKNCSLREISPSSKIARTYKKLTEHIMEITQ